jgi:hypothetical protein
MFQVTQLIFFTIIVLQPMTTAFGFDGSRYFSILWFVVFLGLIIGKIVEKKRDFPRISLPVAMLSSVLLVVVLIHGFEFRLVLNALQFLFAAFTIYIILYYVVYFEDYELFFSKIYLSLAVYFYIVLFLSTLLTAYGVQGAPPIYFWLCDGLESRAQLMYAAGNHFGVYLSALSLISAVSLISQKRWFHIITAALCIYFLIISGARTGQVAIMLLAVMLLFKLLRLRFIYLFYGITVAGVIIYVIVFNADLYYYVYSFFSYINERVPLRFMPEARYHLLAGREVLWSTLVEMIRSKPLWGHGYYIPFYDFGIDVGFEGGRLVGNETAATSESGLLFTVRYGVIATAFYLFFIVKPIFKRQLDSFDFYHFYIVLFAFCVWLLNDSLFISYSIQILFFYFIIAGQMTAGRRHILRQRYLDNAHAARQSSRLDLKT